MAKALKLTPKNRIMIVAGLLCVLLISWYVVSANSDTRVSRALKNMPQGSVQITNDQGRNVTLQVRIADTREARTANFKNSGVKTIQDNIIFMPYTSDSSERHSVQGVKAAVEIGFFRADGTLIQISKTRVGATTTYGTTGTNNRYRYAIMAPEGFFARQNISVDGGATLLANTLRRR